MDNLDVEKGLKGDERIIAEAKRRFKQCEDWEATARLRFVEDIKFANADSDNKYQWPDGIRNARDLAKRPCLTINKTRQHNLHIINDAKQNTPECRVIPVGDGATFEAAQTFEGIFRHINYISDADVAYDTATEFQVEGGIGYVRVVTDFTNDDSFDQEIYIREVKDPLTIYLDPDIKKKNGSDAGFAFVYNSVPRDEFEDKHPQFIDMATKTVLGATDSWSDEYHVMMVEYFRVVEKSDKLIAIADPNTGETTTHRLSKVPAELKEIAKQVMAMPGTRLRDIKVKEVEHYLIVGEKIAKRTIWPGKCIPIVRVIGEETVIDGEMDRKGHTRALKDPQRMYNYHSSAAVEFVALQSKSPYVAPAQAIEGLETYWDSANTDNHAFLPFNHLDDDGTPIPAPFRVQPPVASTAYVQAMQTSQNEMDMASGQYEATFGEKSNERSGVAINARQRQGATATYHYIDNLAIAIRFVGEILIDLIPKIYDTQRMVRIIAEDGSDSEVRVDPQGQQAYMEHMQQVQQGNEKRVTAIFNPNVGKYSVMADVAPGYATRRQEAFNALSDIIARNPNAAMLLGDLWAENADFPQADKIAERFRNMLPPQALGEGQNPQVAQLQQQLQQAQGVNAKLMQSLAESSLTAKGNALQGDVAVFNAQTNRMKVEADILDKHIVTPKVAATMMHSLAMQEHAGDLSREASERAHEQAQATQAAAAETTLPAAQE